MQRSIEWRTNNAYESLLIVFESGRTAGYQLETAFSPAAPDEIATMLTDLGDLQDWQGNETPPDEGVEAPDYGALVLKLDEDGGVLARDMPRIEERLYFLFGEQQAAALLAAVRALIESPTLADYQGLTA